MMMPNMFHEIAQGLPLRKRQPQIPGGVNGGGLLQGLHQPQMAPVFKPDDDVQAPVAADPTNEIFGQALGSIGQLFKPQAGSAEEEPAPMPQNFGIIGSQANPYAEQMKQYAMQPRRPAFGGYRQTGGPVKKKRAYVVGERGPELFEPQEDGMVIPNDDISRFNIPPITPVNPPPLERPMGTGTGSEIDPAIFANIAQGLQNIPAPPQANPIPGVQTLGGLTVEPPVGVPSVGLPATPDRPQELPLQYQPGFDPRRSDLENARERYSSIAATPAEKQDPWKQALFMALQGISQTFNPQADFSPQWLGNAKKGYQLEQAGASLAPLEAQERSRLQGIKTQSEIEENEAQAQAQMENIERLRRKEAAEGNEWTQVKRSGRWFRKFKDGREEPIIDPGTGKQDVEPGETAVETTLPGGQKFTTTGNREIDRQIARDYRQAQMNFEAGKYNTTEWNKYQNDLEDYAEKELARSQKNIEDTNQANAKANDASVMEAEAERLEENGLLPEASTARTKAAQLRSESDALFNVVTNSKPLPTPTPPNRSLRAPNLSVGSYSESDFVSRAKAKGISGEKLKAAIKKAREDGVIK